MKIHYVAGISTDRFIINFDNSSVKECVIGYDASWTRRAAKYAHEDVIKAAKYKWKTTYNEKPFIGDALPEGWKEAEWSGYNVFTGNDFSETDLEKVKEHIEREGANYDF